MAGGNDPVQDVTVDVRQLDSHVDSHGGATPAHQVEPMHNDRASGRPRTTLNDPMDAEHPDS